MAKITQYSRISHHTITGTVSAGLTFSVPVSEDFTDGTWTVYDLALSEIGVNENDEKVYIRVGSNIKEFIFTDGGTYSSFIQLSDIPLSTTASTVDVITYSVVQSGNYLLDAQVNFSITSTYSTSLTINILNDTGVSIIATSEDYILYDSSITSCNKSMSLNCISKLAAGDLIHLQAKAWDTNACSVIGGSDGRTYLNIIKI